MNYKECSVCHEIKEVKNFGVRNDRPCGYQSSCNDCKAKKARYYRASKKGFIKTRENERRYLKTEKGKITYLKKLDNRRKSEKAKETKLKYNQTEKAKELNKLRKRRYREKNKLKEKCRSEFLKAIARKEIKRGRCIKCGKINAEGHHEDYSKPFDVIWLCKKHHTEHHFLENRIKKGYAK